MALTEFSAREYLKIDVANSFGLDKENWDVRINWFDANEPILESLINDAETPALYFAGVQAWRDVCSGKPSGYPISLDACASGSQLLACLIGDTSAASMCGVIDTGNREDIYTNVYNLMLAEGVPDNVSRADTKRALMTSLYGSEQEPAEVFGTGDTLHTFYHVVQTHMPYVWELNAAFLDMWNPEATMYSWVLPDNFHVHNKVMATEKEQVTFLGDTYEVTKKVNKPTKKGRSLCANVVHSIDAMIVRELTRRCSYDMNQINKVGLCLMQYGVENAKEAFHEDEVTILWGHYKQTGYLSARILDYINEDTVCYVDRDVVMELVESLPKKPFNILAIHDAFRVLPAYGNDLREQYNLQLAMIAKSNLLSSIVSQIVGQDVDIGKADENMWKQIKDANYALS